MNVPDWPRLDLKGRALTRLRGGQMICVDLESVDALPYIYGIDIEPDVVRVFELFLRPQSVVLDIGANFGLYTALAGRVVLPRGRLYAFEANPRVFRCLQATIVANRFWPAPRIAAANILVGAHCGRGTLFYEPDTLGGGTMSDNGAGDRHAVEVDMTTIDAYLPDEIVVDLAKIDVEGHEPAVLRGMERTIARSPSIRLIVEFVPAFLEATGGAAACFAAIRDLGLGVCRIMPDSCLRPVLSHDELPEFSYCLLTRTPEADAALVEARLGSLPERLRRWSRRYRPRRRGRALVRRLA
jgi:FkbM family methyltransferase